MGGGFIRCRVIDEDLKRHYGDFLFEDESKAHELASLGLVEFDTENGDEQQSSLTRADQAGSPSAAAARTPSVPPAHAPEYLKRTTGFNPNSAGRRVAWIQDFKKVGGAELSNYAVVKVGEQLGYDIVGVTPSLFDTRVLGQADLVVVNNFFEFSPSQLTTVRQLLHEKRVPYVKYEHDLRELRRVNISRPLFRDAALVVFISPLHQGIYQKALGAECTARSVVLPLAIEVDVYKPAHGMKRERGLTIVPTPQKMNPHDLETYLGQNPDRNLLIIGQCAIPLPPQRVEYIKRCPRHEMVKHYSRCEFMLHQPVQDWAGERVYFESRLCGCTPIVNEKVGHVSWEFNDEDMRDKLSRAPADFWKAVEEVVE